MALFENLHDVLAAALSRTYRRLAHWCILRILDALDFFRSVIIFVPLIYLAAGGYELVYSTAPLLRTIGWFVVGTSVGLMVWATVDAYRSRHNKDLPQAPNVWLVCLVLTILIAGLISTVHYSFQSPILSTTQTLPRRLADTFRGHPKTASICTDVTSTILPHSSGWQHFTSSPVLATDSDSHLSLWIEKITSTSSETYLCAAAKSWAETEAATLADASGSYIIDQNGKKYDLIEDQGDYSFFRGHRTIVGGEIYRWALAFPRISPDALTIKLKHPKFSDVVVSFSSRPNTAKAATEGETATAAAARPSALPSIADVTPEGNGTVAPSQSSLTDQRTEDSSLVFGEPVRSIRFNRDPIRSLSTLKWPDVPVYLWITGVDLFKERTVIQMACRNVDEGEEGALLSPCRRLDHMRFGLVPVPDGGADYEDAYLSDQGVIAEFKSTSLQFKQLTQSWYFYHLIRPHERLKFYMEFSGLPTGAKLITLYHRQFGTIDISLDSGQRNKDAAGPDRGK